MTSDASAFVLELEPGRVRVLDRRQKRLFPVTDEAIVLSRGRWEPFDGDQARVLLLADRYASREEVQGRE